MALGVVDLDLVGILVVGHRDDERALMAVGVNSRRGRGDREERKRRTQYSESRFHHDVHLKRQEYPHASKIFRCPGSTLYPLVPPQDPAIRTRVFRQHGDVLQQVAIGIMKVD